MQGNAVNTTDPAAAYRQGQIQTRPPQQQAKSWAETDDLSDWGKFVKP
jgi:hypothetical protein